MAGAMIYRARLGAIYIPFRRTYIDLALEAYLQPCQLLLLTALDSLSVVKFGFWERPS